VANRYVGALTRIDPVTEQVTRFDVGAEPRAAIASAGRLWVASGPSADPAHRGGTLTVAAVDLPGGFGQTDLPGDFVLIDPAFVYEIITYQAERVVYEGLVAARYSSTDPQTLVPSLAVRIPRPSDGGRTYTFQLRQGLRYSTGTPVVASDFRRGLERVGVAGPAALYRLVVGMPACLEHRGACDLSRGVETDDLTGRVSIHLSSPDPNLLNKLTTLVYPVPAGFQPGVTGPQPGTGPYAITEYRRGTSFVLRRNPWFKPRSAAASPEGYPDTIRYLKVANLHEVVDAVLHGRADVGNLTPIKTRSGSGSLVADLRVSRPALVHASNAMATDFVVLNSAVPPFDNLLARQAVSSAVDRAKLAELMGGTSVSTPSCQLLPPGFPGYRAYCPFTPGAADGDYHGPDLARARALVDQSGTKGAVVTVVDLVGDYTPPFERYMVGVLRSLGYRAILRELPDTAANETWMYDDASHVQVMSGGWIPDYPGPSTFYDAIVRCHGFGYPTGYCNAGLDRRADAAQALQVTDPGRALREWSAIDHEVADQAPIVFAASEVVWWITAPRVGNYQSSPYLGGALLSQLWVH
jgi:ABC-type transport system substrate-binding protein